MKILGPTLKKGDKDVALIEDVPTKLSQLENDIGAGGGTNIVPSATEPTGISTGDWWYEEL